MYEVSIVSHAIRTWKLRTHVEGVKLGRQRSGSETLHHCLVVTIVRPWYDPNVGSVGESLAYGS
jgi:hypothetical protein